MTFLCYDKCGTCRKAKQWLQEQAVSCNQRDIKTENPTIGELRLWFSQSGLPLRKFFNTSGLLYKSMNLKEKLKDMTEEEQLQLLASDGMLVKRPLLILEDRVLVGFQEAEWAEVLKVR